MDPRLAKLLSLGNLLEAGLWLLFAMIFFVMALRSSQRKRRLWLVVAITFVAFAISDIIEAQTGAWWRPWPLLVLKGGCLVVFACVFWQFRRMKIDS